MGTKINNFCLFSDFLLLGLIQYIARTGDKVLATNKEIKTAADTVIPKGLKNRPKLPPIKAIGRNTVAKVKVEADTVKPISSVPLIAACLGLIPSSI